MLIAFTAGSALLGLSFVITMASQYSHIPNSFKRVSHLLDESRTLRNSLCCTLIAIIFAASLSTMVRKLIETLIT